MKKAQNFFLLKNPIFDDYWNKYYDSEGYYMAERIGNLEVKRFISFYSSWYWLSKKAAYLHEDMLNSNEIDRIKIMEDAIIKKFENNLELRKKLIATWSRDIIEFTFWWDTFFWIDSSTRKGKNILWKLLMKYRDKIKKL